MLVKISDKPHKIKTRNKTRENGKSREKRVICVKKPKLKSVYIGKVGGVGAGRN